MDTSDASDDRHGLESAAFEPGGNYSVANGNLPDAESNPPRLLDRLCTEIRLRHYSLRTEEAYAGWARRFILLHGKRHPNDLGVEEFTQFLPWIATERQVSAATQNQARAALLFLYAQVLKIELPWLGEVVSARVQRRLPVVLTPAEVRALLHEMSGLTGLNLGVRSPLDQL